MPPQPTLNQLLHEASRTFALGIDLLPEPLRTEVETAYLVLRVSDYLEDNESMPAGRKAELLEAWAAVLGGDSAVGGFLKALGPVPDTSPDARVARHAGRVHQALALLRAPAREAIARHTRDSTLGMARWVRRGPDFPDEAALDDYMHEVAGRVGWLLTDLFADALPRVAREGERMRTLGRDFGLALQTVNVIRGLHHDWERGWIYVPRSFVPDGAPPLERLLGTSDGSSPVERAILDRLVVKAGRHLEAAESYLAGLPRRAHRVRVFCLLPYLFAVRTLAVSRDNPRVFREETKIGRDEVRAIVRWSTLLGWSQRWVRWYSRRLAGSGRPAQEAPSNSPASASP
jgi:farnesyl-diphosphate farnesyltransferase